MVAAGQASSVVGHGAQGEEGSGKTDEGEGGGPVANTAGRVCVAMGVNTCEGRTEVKNRMSGKRRRHT